MLDKKLLFGQTTNKIDKRNRIFLPAYTGREKGEVVFIVYDNDINEYKIVPKSVIEAEYKDLEFLVNSAYDLQTLREYKLRIVDFANSILKEVTVDDQGRILLPDCLTSCDDITIIGAGNHLILRQEKNNEKKK